MTLNPVDVNTLLDKLIAILEGKKRSLEDSIKALQTLKTHAQHLPLEMVEALMDSIKSVVGARRVGRPAATPSDDEVGEQIELFENDESTNHGKTHFQKIVDFFVGRGNKPAHNLMIRSATGLSRGAVAMVLYKSRAESFTRVELPGKPKKVWWKIKDDVFKELKGDRDGGKSSVLD